MLRAERRAHRRGELLRPDARPAAALAGEDDAIPHGRLIHAAIPIVMTVLVCVGGMLWTGYEAAVAEGIRTPSLRQIVGRAAALDALLWASLAGSTAALLVAKLTRTMRARAAFDAFIDGVKSMVPACIILVLAWALGTVCVQLDTAHVIVAGVDAWMQPELLPAVVFVVAGVTSFATGSSWGAMAILYPLVVPLAANLAPAHDVVLHGTIGSILAGAVWGNHCSPIADNAVLSSAASSCDPVDHIQTQLPYALAIGGLSVVALVATGYGLCPPWVALLASLLGLVAFVRLRGHTVEAVGEHRPEGAASRAALRFSRELGKGSMSWSAGDSIAVLCEDDLPGDV
jgi:Na+/H+ antiporter NhaC